MDSINAKSASQAAQVQVQQMKVQPIRPQPEAQMQTSSIVEISEHNNAVERAEIARQKKELEQQRK